MKTYLKLVFRTIKLHIGRFIAISAIIALGMGFMVGLGSVQPKLETSLNNDYKTQNVPDVILKSTSPMGFNQAQVNEIISNSQIYSFMQVTTYDILKDDDAVRVYYMPLQTLNLNNLKLISGTLPKNENEVLVERNTKKIKKHNVGDVISFNGKDVVVSGIALNPLLFCEEDEPSNFTNISLSDVIYFDSQLIEMPIVSDLYLQLNMKNKNIFSNGYKNYVQEEINALVSELDFAESIKVLTLQQNKSVVMYGDFANKVQNISIVFSIFFILVVALVVLTTMTRLVEEERSVIGCFKTLGFGNGKINFKYFLFAFLSCIIGSLVGFLLIANLLVDFIYKSFEFSFFMPPKTNQIPLLFGSVAMIAMLAVIIFVTYLIVRKLTGEKPANLLKPKAPKPGKKILLERIPFIWNKLSFKYKSTFRNLFRYVSHFLMTIITIAGSTALIFAGFGLFDSSKHIGTGVGAQSTSSMESISIILIVCAALLNILVIYNLTNVNIEERKREIATLKVLGYRYGEVSGYIFREILILSIIGTVIGLPIGYLLAGFIFNYVNFGSVSYMNWYSWVLTVVLSISFTLIVNLLLYKKITKTDMNASLKTVE